MSSSIEENNPRNILNTANRETAMAAVNTSSSEQTFIPAKITEKSSETHFDRNNENINPFHNKSSPSNLKQQRGPPKEYEMSAQMSQTPSQLVHKPSGTQSPLFRNRHKCTCRKRNRLSSSSSSTFTSDLLPQEPLLCLTERSMPLYVENMLRYFPPKPQRLQPNSLKDCGPSSNEQFYSCSSEDVDSEEDGLNAVPAFDGSLPKQFTPTTKTAPRDLADEFNDISSRLLIQTSQEKVQLKNKVSRSMSLSLATPFVGCLPQCFCCCQQMTHTQVPPLQFPCIRPYNLGFPAAESNDCSRDNRSGLRGNQVPCVCYKITAICPRHGPLKTQTQRPDGTDELQVSSRICEVSQISSIAKHEFTVLEQEMQVKSEFDAEEYVDEELHPRCVDKVFVEPFGDYKPGPDCLLQYDDEEPTIACLVEESKEETPSPCGEYNEFDPASTCALNQDLLKKDDDQEFHSSDLLANENEVLGKQKTADKGHLPQTKDRPFTAMTLLNATASGKLNEATISTGVKANETVESKRLIPWKESEEETDYSFNCGEENGILGNEAFALAQEHWPATKQHKGETSAKELKFFIDSLVMDLDAMDYARRKSAFVKNVCPSKCELLVRNSFPVTILDVQSLGANSLYVKWHIHDSCGVAGYEIFTDGYLTNRYYNSRHKAGVITNIDITVPHKVALVAQPYGNEDSIQPLVCNTMADKRGADSLLWKSAVEENSKSQSASWTPSIFLYDPVACS